MRVYRRFEELNELDQPIYWALGFFDGMHRGHQQVIAAAQKEDSLCGMLSFAKHPLSLLAPERSPQLITPYPEQKLAYAREYGVDIVLLLDFTPELATMSPAAFLDTLASHCRVTGLSSGRNWHFGHRGLGDSAFLEQSGKSRGWEVAVADLLQDEENHVISSSEIRCCLQSGELNKAIQLLGHPFALRGEVIHGQHLARQWNYPTANIHIPDDTIHPLAGVYAVDAIIDGERVAGVANIGLRPTIEEDVKRVLLEVHFFDWEGDLYGQVMDISMRYFIREEKRFSSIDELRAQIATDAAHARELLSC